MTVKIADELLARAREIAKCEETTLRALVEEGLRIVLARRVKPEPRREGGSSG